MNNRKAIGCCSLIVFIMFFCIIPEKVIAGYMSQRKAQMAMPKYSLNGILRFTYYDYETDGKQTTKKYISSVDLKFKGYYRSPRILHYTIHTGFGYQKDSVGNRDSRTTLEYGIRTDFFSTSPVRFTLYASRLDDTDYETTTYGLSIIYLRQQKKVRDDSWNRNNNNRNFNNRNANNRNFNSRNFNSRNFNNRNFNNRNFNNRNFNNNNFYNNNFDNNNFRNISRPKRRIFPAILPKSIIFDAERSERTGRNATNSHHASLRFRGNYATTDYFWNFTYLDYERNEHDIFTSRLNVITGLNWKFFSSLRNNLYFKRENVNSYSLRTQLDGSRWGWAYSLIGIYEHSPGSDDEVRFEFSLSRSDRFEKSFIYKGFRITYSLGLYVASRSDNDYILGARGTIRADKRIGLRTDFFSILSASIDTDNWEYLSRTGIDHSFKPKRGNGWNYVLSTGYRLHIRDTNRGFVSAERGSGTEGGTQVSHIAYLQARGRIKAVNFSSKAQATYLKDFTRITWDTKAYTKIKRRVGLTFGSIITYEMREHEEDYTEYDFYNIITYSPWRRAFLSVKTRYVRVEPVDSHTISFAPTLTWQWRQLYMRLSVEFTRTDNGKGRDVKQRRIIFSATRPLWIL